MRAGLPVADATPVVVAVTSTVTDVSAGDTPPGLGGTSGTITIPTLSVTQAVGALLRAQLPSGAIPTWVRARRGWTATNG